MVLWGRQQMLENPLTGARPDKTAEEQQKDTQNNLNLKAESTPIKE